MMQGIHVAIIVAIIVLSVAVPVTAVVFLIRCARRPRCGMQRTDRSGRA